MNKRPVSIAIISWYLIIVSGGAVIFLPFSLHTAATQQFMVVVGASPLASLLIGGIFGIVNVVAGAAMLNKRNWGRSLYLIGAPVGFLFTIIFNGIKLLPLMLSGFVIYAIILVFLFNRRSTEYFLNQTVEVPLPNGSTDQTVSISNATALPVSGIANPEFSITKRIASVLLLIPGGFTVYMWSLLLIPLSSKFQVSGVLMLSGFFFVVSSAFIIPAIFLWGRKRWAVVLGTLLATVSGVLLMIALTSYQLKDFGPEANAAFAKIDPQFLDLLTRGMLFFGIVNGGIAIALIMYQRFRDKKQRPFHLSMADTKP